MVTLIIIVLIGIVVFQYLTIQGKNKEIEAQDEIIRQLNDELEQATDIEEFD